MQRALYLRAYNFCGFLFTQGYERYTVSTNYAGCSLLDISSKDPTECAKFAGVILMHFGQLRAYGEGNPEVVEVNKRGLCVRFNAWHSKRIVNERPIPVVIAEAIFVKRVGNLSCFFLPLSLSPYPSHLALPLSVPISPCVLLARCMKTTGDESASAAIVNLLERNTRIALCSIMLFESIE